MVSASTRRLPSTAIWAAACAFAFPAMRTDMAALPKITPPRTTPAKVSPRNARHHSFMRNVPYFPSCRPFGPDGRNRLDACTRFFRQCNIDPRSIILFCQGVARPQRSRPDPMEYPRNVVVGRENQQHQDDCKPDPELDLLGPLGKRPASHRLECVEQKVTPIEQRNRKQIEQPDSGRTEPP